MARSLTTVACMALALLTLVATPTQAWNQGANGTVALGASFFNKISAAAIPLIEKEATNITIGPLNGTKPMTFKVGAFKLQELDVGGFDVTFETPNTVTLKLIDVNISVPSTPFSASISLLKGEQVAGFQVGPEGNIGCKGTFTGGTTNMHATFTIALATNASGKLVGTVGLPTLSVGDFSFKVNMAGLCALADSTVEAEVTKMVTKMAKTTLPLKIQNITQGLMAKDLPKIPFHFASQPAVMNDTMEMNVELIPPFQGQAGGSKVLAAVAPMVTPHIFTDRDVSIGINSQSFDDLVAAGAQQGLFHFSHEFSGKYNTSLFASLIPAVYKACPSCPFGIDFSIQPNSPPTAVFGGDALQFNFTNAVMNFTAQNGSHVENLFSIFANISFGITNFTVQNLNQTTTVLKFDLALNQFALAMDESSVGPIDVTKFGGMIQHAIKDMLVPMFNSGFKGFPLSVDKDGFGLDSWKVDLHQDAITLGANLLLPANLPPIAQGTLRGRF